MSTLLSKYWKYGTIALVVLVAYASGASRGQKDLAVQRDEKKIDSIQVVEHDTITKFVHDTVYLAKVEKNLAVISDSFVKNTKLIHDTVFVQKYIASLDTANKVCTNTLVTCETIHQQDQAQISTLHSEVGTLKSLGPPSIMVFAGPEYNLNSKTVGANVFTSVHITGRLSAGISTDIFPTQKQPVLVTPEILWRVF